MLLRPKTIIIVGGGTAGWLTAGLLAAKKKVNGQAIFNVKVVEPTTIKAIGVGEGTWPSMRRTLSDIGVSERDFLKQTGASFKQGTKFVNWVHDQGEYYYHPFEAPVSHNECSPLGAWKELLDKIPFAQYAGVQEILCENHRAPKLLTSRDFAGVTNYGYHFEADGLSRFLKNHCVKNLSIEVIPDVVKEVESKESGDISAVITRNHGHVKGDFFVDCTGFRSLLLKQHFKSREHPLGHIFLSDRAITARVPYHKTSKIESTTLSTAQRAGWIWDVSLASRFGAGYVHSSAHISSDLAQKEFADYIQKKGYEPSKLDFRELKFNAGYIDKCWIKNCVAIGLSAGFIEPLEASSIMLTEIAARELASSLSEEKFDRKSATQNFNLGFKARWEQVVHFLKLHYVLSQREDKFWQDSRESQTIPQNLRQDLMDWKEGEPAMELSDSLFPLESYQFVLYGMVNRQHSRLAFSKLSKYQPRLEQYMRLLPTNHDWLTQ